MPERTIRVLYYTTNDGTIYNRGDTVDLSQEEADRGDELGAFAGNRRQPATDASAAAFGTNPNVVGPEPLEEEQPTVVSEMSDEEIDGLSGAELDAAVEDAGIDASEGGSLSGGRMSADEKRAALRDARDAA